MGESQLISGVNEILTPREEKEYIIDVGNSKHFKLYVRTPTWSEKQKAVSKFFTIDAKNKEATFDMSEYYKQILLSCVRTEPQMNVVELLNANTYVGSQIEKVLPAPNDIEFTKEDEKK